jgi:hypothetical protein
VKVKQTHTYTLEVVVERDEDKVYIVAVGIDTESDGGPFHTPRPLDFMQSGFDGLNQRGEVLDVLDADSIPEDYDDEQIIDAYFNSPYGVA